MPKKSLYIPDAIDAIIDASEGESYSGRVGYLVALADRVALDAMPAFTFGEWVAIVTAVRDCRPNYERGPEAVLHDAWNGVLDSVDHSVGGWTIDEAALVKRLKTLPLAAQAAAFEVGRDFWARGHGGGTPSKVRKALQAVGAYVLPEPG
jgi:hypothetical protein